MAGTSDSKEAQQKYKVRLASGREVGPISLEDVLKLIRRGHVHGGERARRHPDGDWQDLRTLEEFRPHLPEDEVTYVGPAPGMDSESAEEATFVGPSSDLLSIPSADPDASPEESLPAVLPEAMELTPQAADSTVVFTREDLKREGIQAPEGHQAGVPLGPKGDLERNRRNLRVRVLGVAIILIGILSLLQPAPKAPPQLKWVPIRPEIPRMEAGKKRDANKSREFYGKAMAAFLKDDLPSYKKAAEGFADAVRADSSNMGAVAMLTASYLNLIDVSLKDEKYFKTILALLDLARSSKLELPEILLAEVEYFIAVRKPEAAVAKIEDYIRKKSQRVPNFSWPLELHFLFALAHFERGDWAEAAKFLTRIPENGLRTPRLSYLRGQIAEKTGDFETALLEYQRALEMEPTHARSRLRLAYILVRKKDFTQASPHLARLVSLPQHLLPTDLALAFYLSHEVHKAAGNRDVALADIQKAVKLEPENRLYKVEYFDQRAAAGKGSPQLDRESKMYTSLISADRLIKEGKHREALVSILAARSENPDSIEPLVEAGNLFMYMNDVANARYNYEQAARMAPKDIKVWSKYINSLIDSFEWAEAEKAMAAFRRNPEAGSTVDKAAGDLYARMGRYEDALGFYMKAMARETIDPGVYLAMANLLMKLRKYEDAPLFYSLALRVDPLNVDAEIGIARAAAETEGIDVAVQLLKSKLSGSTRASAPYEAAIAELMIRKKEWETARVYINQAQSRDSEYAYPWKLLGQLYRQLDGIEKNALENALDAYKSYSDRNPSDPSGYLEAFKIKAFRGKFEEAEELLEKVVSIYPKYPQYHYWRGWLYSKQGNFKVAASEFAEELKSDPSSLPALLALGEALIELRDYKAASAKFSEAMQLDPGSAKAKYLAGYAASLQGNHMAAVALFQASAAQNPTENPLLFKRLGDSHRALGNIPQANEAYRKYRELEPDGPMDTDLRRP